MAESSEVGIVGGGPVGLLTALLLAEAGIEVALFEAAASPPRDLRATSFHPPTLDMLADIGLAEGLIARGLVCPSWQIRIHPTGERAVFEVATIAAETRHPFRLQCEQWHLAELLLGRLRGLPNVAIRQDAAVTGFSDLGESVRVSVASAGGESTHVCRLLVGADGLGSVVRRGLGLPFHGETLPETTLVVVTPFRFEDHIEDLSHVTSAFVPGSHVAMLHLPGVWRLALYPREDLPLEAQLTDEAVEAVLQGLVARAGRFEVSAKWPYRVQQRIAPSYRTGRVAIAGDAAHVNSPAGGMGLNAGIHDAFALAAALRDILRHDAPLARLDLYDRQRRPIVAEHILGQAAGNRDRMRERDPARRRAILQDLQAIAADRDRHRDFVRRASMIDGLRRAAAIS